MNLDTYLRMLFGEHAAHVPAWLYVQDMGSGLVTFAGASRVDGGGPHPLRYGSDRTHQLIVGELVVRPHTVHATDDLQGTGIGGLITGTYHDDAMAGDLVIGPRPAPPRRSTRP